ncbi:RabGAP/TBC [Ramicandelaber brevisporus]|nr:RabGAP/TBC [Ramicandelaber brevisporus]
MGYLPTNANRREATLVRKRREYEECVSTTFSRGESLLDQTLWHQIQIDVPRTCPDSPLFQDDQIQQSIAKLLYCWADRHPASGYVQGINDLVTPFYMVIGGSTSNGKVKSVRRRDRIPEDILAQVEADSFWCLSKLLDGIQDNYIHAQPGIHRQIQRLSDLITRIDTPLATHLSQEGIDFIQFAFRWVNCLLMREMSLPCTVRMWDTYLSEDGGTGFSDFHVYVCAAFLVKWSEKIRKMDFQEIMLFLQNIPTDKWTAKDIEVLLAEAYMWKSLFQDSKAHLNK